MRLIDADAVSAEIEKLMFPTTSLDAVCYNAGVNDALSVIDDALSVIDDAKSVDAVPVVRCRDCEYSDEPTWTGLADLIH